MKKISLIFLMSLAVFALSCGEDPDSLQENQLACPNFSGKYVVEEENDEGEKTGEKTEFAIAQLGCEKLKFVGVDPETDAIRTITLKVDHKCRTSDEMEVEGTRVKSGKKDGGKESGYSCDGFYFDSDRLVHFYEIVIELELPGWPGEDPIEEDPIEETQSEIKDEDEIEDPEPPETITIRGQMFYYQDLGTGDILVKTLKKDEDGTEKEEEVARIKKIQ